ncbi:hypothetical protein SERLA73DRAFT_176819 [Serpula lacrymans var. lacrymans S7.3]|uniref:Uncharacterized protein n=2 Tax=Serpula lacrymans var. lacrymans TaxID=341189 RepID=F8PQ48_SERL3|nr:uncharacterized protein SERLADRAFT_460093 [Serpula lacrymans var. lacrymans S7.9]EGO01513.1 hypothetical protein SERLA73DRAFT_176819 [Serpula lacrymans var. lacrymans S7.3]EGO27167.1 hypothetical protein SERLADRAFT_460093 [Serpula lacrymans var. lacrymans S7.9]
MARRVPRIHRLPQRLDYTLIPAPLDLSLPLATEKSALPAIIVTPSSPTTESEYYIAFLTPPPKPTFRERISPYLAQFQPQFPFKARTAIIVSLLLFLMVCHLLAHLAVSRPHLDFYNSSDGISSFGGDKHSSASPVLGFLDLKSFWGTSASGARRNFIIQEDSS